MELIPVFSTFSKGDQQSEIFKALKMRASYRISFFFRAGFNGAIRSKLTLLYLGAVVLN